MNRARGCIQLVREGLITLNCGTKMANVQCVQHSFLRTIGRNRGTNSCLTIAPEAFDDSRGWHSTVHPLFTFGCRPSIVLRDSVQGVRHYGPALVKDIYESGRGRSQRMVSIVSKEHL